MNDTNTEQNDTATHSSGDTLSVVVPVAEQASDISQIDDPIPATGPVLQQAREEANLSQKAVADKLKCSAANISAMENGTGATVKGIIMYARAIGARASDLIRRMGE
jgi:hypothetical protein